MTHLASSKVSVTRDPSALEDDDHLPKYITNQKCMPVPPVTRQPSAHSFPLLARPSHHKISAPHAGDRTGVGSVGNSAWITGIKGIRGMGSFEGAAANFNAIS